MTPRLTIAATGAVLVAATGAAIGWYRVADSYVVSAQMSRAIATGFGALTTIAFIAVLSATFSSRRHAARRRAVRVEAISLATTAVESLLHRRIPGGPR